MSRKEELTDLDRKIIGPPRIITVPLSDKSMISEAGDLLAGLGHQMKLYAMQPHNTKTVALLVAAEIRRVNSLIREYAEAMEIDMPRRGRKPSLEAEQGGNEQGTDEIVSFAKPPHRVPRYRR